MRTEIRQKLVDYEVYITKDGKEFTNPDDAKHHELILEGIRKVCPNCGGKRMFRGKWVEPYDNYDIGHVDGHYEYEYCKMCGGKGWLEKKETWE